MKKLDREMDDRILLGYLRDEAAVLCMVAEPDGTIVDVNRFTLEFIGHDADAIEAGNVRLQDVLVDFNDEGKDVLERLGSEDVRALLNVAGFTGLPQSFQCVVHHLAGGRLLILGSLDTVEQEKLREQLINVNREMAHLSRQLYQKNSELSRLNHEKNLFLGMAAHDLRNPAGAIASLADFLFDDLGNELSKEGSDWLRHIKEQSQSMLAVINDFLDVSSIDAGIFRLNLQKDDLGEVVRQALRLCVPYAKKHGVVLEYVEPPSPLPPVSIDVPKIGQVLGNLVRNAVEYSPSNGTVVIAVQLDMGGRLVKVYVQDSGEGIGDDERQQLFQAFGIGAASKRTGGSSTGLGLLIARKIVEAHGGQIGLADDEERPDRDRSGGACFVFDLPVSRER